jgi:hypothetical protein
MPLTTISNGQTVYLKDAKASGTDGGTFTSGAFQTRTLNTLENSAAFPWISLSANQFTLQPGTYAIDASAPARAVDSHVLRIRNITASSDEIIGMVENVNASVSADTTARLFGNIVVATASVYELQHRCTTTKTTNGFGGQANFGVNEIYSMVKITKLP